MGSPRRLILILAFSCAAVLGALGADSLAPATTNKPSPAAPFLKQAGIAFGQGDWAAALASADRAVAADPTNAEPYSLRGRLHEERREFPAALIDFDRALKLAPQFAPVYHHRGQVQFRLGHFAEAVADFDRFLELNPERAPYHWQRGIALYYAGKFAEGRQQFELHQTVNPHDVENAVWHYLCVARLEGVERARAALIPISGDARVPLAQIHALFAGTGTAADVLAAARAGNPSPTDLNDRLFYAHLYLGLYAEAAGDKKGARQNILKAAADFKSEHYMGDVARVHAALLRAAKL